MIRADDQSVISLGVVSYLNARPLIDGLDAGQGISLCYAVPSLLAGMLRREEVTAALIPVVDLARAAAVPAGDRGWEVVSDACIGCDGEAWTVRVLSRVPPERMHVLHVDDDSHTSVVLAQLLWARMYKRPLRIAPLSSAGSLENCEAVLLIGDKAIAPPPAGFSHVVDLGGAWKSWTGLPFVFAVWAAPAGQPRDKLAALLSAARDRGVARAPQIAAEIGPAQGWQTQMAAEYLTRVLRFTLTPRAREGMRMFLDLAAEEGIIARPREFAA